MVVIAIGAGAAVGVVTRPAPSVEPSATPVRTATPTPDTGPLVFKQPLTAGCATDDAVWVVSDGGGIGRFDRLLQRWELIDSTLRSLVAVACGQDTVLAVGAFGHVVTIDDVAKTIRGDDIGLFDAYAISLLWKQFVTGTTASLRTIAAASPAEAIAAGDDGVLLRFDGNWRPLESGVKQELRASARVGPITYVVGDGGTALAVEGNTVRPITKITTTCALRGVFARGNEVWFVGSEGTLAGVWRQTPDRIDRWGTC